MSSQAPGAHVDDDERTLHKLGYAQVLYREMGGFSNFAISFTIISILAPPRSATARRSSGPRS